MEQPLESARPSLRIDWPTLAGLTAISVLARLILVLPWSLPVPGGFGPINFPLNQAEYTDGILQLTLFSKGNPYWPPFYSALAVGLGSLLGDLEMGGRLISAIFGGLAILPILLIAHRIGGAKSATFAALIFLVLPEPMRWGIRVMTDALFLTLFAAAIYLTMPDEQGQSQSTWRLILATMVSVLAGLTRYQGVLLILPLLWAAVSGARRGQKIWPVLAMQVLWLAIPLWMFRGGFAHMQQFSDRSGAALGLSRGETLLAYWNLAENYLYLFPYSISLGVFCSFLIGFFSPAGWDKPLRDNRGFWNPSPARWLMILFFICGAAILVAQSAFGIFEFRYMLPMIAFVAPYAGIGLERIDQKLSGSRAAALIAFAVVLIPPMLLSMGSLLLQREAFGDVKAASIRAAQIAGPNHRIYTNEFYNARIPVVKTAFWARRPVEYDPEYRNFVRNITNPQLPPITLPAEQRLRAGDVIIYCNLYSVGTQIQYLNYLNQIYDVDIADNVGGQIVPLLPDIMEVPGTHGNALSWFYRYQPQTMQTLVLRIRKLK